MVAALLLLVAALAVAIATQLAHRDLAWSWNRSIAAAAFLWLAFSVPLAASGVLATSGAIAGAAIVLCALILETDRRHFIIPDTAVLALLALAAIAPFAPDWRMQLIGAALAGALMLGVRQGYHALRGAHGLGLGDVKLAFAVGALVGPRDALIVIAVAAIATAALLSRARTQPASPIPDDIPARAAPFGVALAAAAAATIFIRAGTTL